MKFIMSLMLLLTIIGLTHAAPIGDHINVRMIDTNKEFQLPLDSSEDVASIKAKIKDKWNVPPESQSLYLAPNYLPLEEGHTLAEFKIHKNDDVWVHVQESDEKKLFVRPANGTFSMFELPFDQGETIASIKSRVERRWNVSAAEQTLYGGSLVNQLKLEDDKKTLEDYGLVGSMKPDTDSTIWVYSPKEEEKQVSVRTI